MKSFILMMVCAFLASLAALAAADEYNVPVGDTLCAVAANVPQKIYSSDEKFSTCTIWPDPGAASVTAYFGNTVTAAGHGIAEGQSLTYNAYNPTLLTTGIWLISTEATKINFISTKIRTMD